MGEIVHDPAHAVFPAVQLPDAEGVLLGSQIEAIRSGFEGCEARRRHRRKKQVLQVHGPPHALNGAVAKALDYVALNKKDEIWHLIGDTLLPKGGVRKPQA